MQSSSNNVTTAAVPSSNPTASNKKTTCRNGRSAGRKVPVHRRGRGKCSTTSKPVSRKQPQTLSESRSQNYGITAPITRSLCGLKPIDYVSLNDGFEDELIETPKRKKRDSHRPKVAPSATGVAAQKNTVSPEAKEPAKKQDIKKPNTLSGIPPQTIPAANIVSNLTGIPDPPIPDTLPDLVTTRVEGC